jgi:hypothetical protein
MKNFRRSDFVEIRTCSSLNKRLAQLRGSGLPQCNAIHYFDRYSPLTSLLALELDGLCNSSISVYSFINSRILVYAANVLPSDGLASAHAYSPSLRKTSPHPLGMTNIRFASVNKTVLGVAPRKRTKHALCYLMIRGLRG